MPSESPLQDYFEKLDNKYYEKSFGWFYYEFAPSVPTKWLTEKFLADMKFRADHQLNIITQTTAEQGQGKSLFNLNMCLWAGKFFDYPFVLKRDIYGNPFELDADLRNNGQHRRTFLFDEQPTNIVGLGSGSLIRSLKDYEEIGRYTQKNLFYCAPSDRTHSCYFQFRQVDYSVLRITNPTCLKCPVASECKKNKVSTLCDIPFYERDGYPKQFSFMLFTRRLSDGMDIPRGVVTFPMVTPKTSIEYDEVKKLNIKKFEEFKNRAWDDTLKAVREFVEKYESQLIKKVYQKIIKKKTMETLEFINFKPEKKGTIEALFYEYFTTGQFTKDEARTLISYAETILNKKCVVLNEEKT